MNPVLRIGLGDPRWRELVDASPKATPFHDPAWAELLAETYRYRGFVLAAADGDGRLLAGAPFIEVRGLRGGRSWISLPFTDECPLLARDAAARSALIDGIGELQEHARAPAIGIRDAIDALGWQCNAEAVIHELELSDDLDAVRRRFSRSQVIRNIKRAEREGVTVRRAATPADLDAFYRLHARTRRRQGVPVQPGRFFELLWERVIERDLGHILLADAGGRRAIAGALFLTGTGTTIYKFGASDVDTLPLRPNHLIFWTAIQDACARGDSCFDFGRTDLDNPGLRGFKAGWGGIERPLRYSTLAADSGGLAIRALSLAIRRGPDWVCRGAGEALYRYAGSR